MGSKLRNTFTELAMLDCKDGVVHYIPTQIRGLDNCQITFLCSPVELSRMEHLLEWCAENPITNKRYLRHIQFMEACYMTKIEDRGASILNILRNEYHDNIYRVIADNTYEGIKWLSRHTILDVEKLTDFWRVSSKGCYLDTDVNVTGLRTDESKYKYNAFNLEIEDCSLLEKRLGQVLEFDCGNHVLNYIVRSLYLIMANPYGQGCERLALSYLENALPTQGIPVAKCISADYNNWYEMLSRIWVKDDYNCIDITKYVSYMIKTICKAAELFTTITKEISKVCLKWIPKDGIKVEDLVKVLSDNLYVTEDIIKMYLTAEYVIDEPTGFITSIY